VTTTRVTKLSLEEAKRRLEIALPVPGEGLEQDEEWVVARTPDGWKKIRLHDYHEVFAVPGLYEKWIYDVLQCKSPDKIRDLFARAITESDTDPSSLRVLDLGAGTGCVAEVLSDLGISHFVGVDIYQEAADAAERDRPGLYDEYFVGDLASEEAQGAKELAREFDVMTCVAALGFGDIPPAVFAAAFNKVRDGGWVAFTIKTDFVSEDDKSGFSQLISRMLSTSVMDLVSRETYQHRVSTDGEVLPYEAFIGVKRRDVPESLVDSANEAANSVECSK